MKANVINRGSSFYKELFNNELQWKILYKIRRSCQMKLPAFQMKYLRLPKINLPISVSLKRSFSIRHSRLWTTPTQRHWIVSVLQSICKELMRQMLIRGMRRLVLWVRTNLCFLTLAFMLMFPSKGIFENPCLQLLSMFLFMKLLNTRQINLPW